MRDLVTQCLLGKRGSTTGELLKDKDHHPKTLTARPGPITLQLIWYGNITSIIVKEFGSTLLVLKAT